MRRITFTLVIAFIFVSATVLCVLENAEGETEVAYPVQLRLTYQGEIVLDKCYVVPSRLVQKYGDGCEKYRISDEFSDVSGTFLKAVPELYEDMSDLAVKYDVEPTNARVDISGSSVHKLNYIGDSSGRCLDIALIYENMISSLFDGSLTMECPFRIVDAEITLDKLQKDTAMISSFSTYYGYSESGRKHNVYLASCALNGIKVAAGETFSFNRVVGERTAARGYKESNQILNGEYVRGVGGGVCQVSSTLFRTVIGAGLKVISRKNHSLAVGYIQKGCDATVSDGVDFVFLNDSDRDVYLFTCADGEKLTISLFGMVRFQKVKILTRVSKIVNFETETVENEDEGILQDGVNGCTIVTDVVALCDDGRKCLYSFKSEYLPVNRRIGKAKAETQ